MNGINLSLTICGTKGGNVDLYGAYKAVLKGSGMQAVTYNRAFKMVAQTSLLPQTFTNFTFNRINEHEKLL